MATPTSRYARSTVLVHVGPDGRSVSFLARRFLPLGRSLPLLTTVTVTQGDRLDLIAARTIGDPEQAWRICDANDAMDPFDLTTTLGATLRIAVPQFQP